MARDNYKYGLVMIMTLDKAIEYNKEHRKQYHGAKAIDKTCRNHGSCDWCKENRLYQHKKQLESVDDKIDEFYYQ